MADEKSDCAALVSWSCLHLVFQFTVVGRTSRERRRHAGQIAAKVHMFREACFAVIDLLHDAGECGELNRCGFNQRAIIELRALLLRVADPLLEKSVHYRPAFRQELLPLLFKGGDARFVLGFKSGASALSAVRVNVNWSAIAFTRAASGSPPSCVGSLA